MNDKISSVRTFQWFTFCLSALTLVLAAGQVFHHPGEIRDLVTGAFFADAGLKYPLAYTLLAPFCQAADHFTILSLTQHITLIIWVNILWILYRLYALKGTPLDRKCIFPESIKWVGFNLAFAACAAVSIFVPRPMAAIRLSDPAALTVDFHSHSSHSWDGRRSFTPYRNLQWHARGGFDAVFITDHNLFRGAEEGRSLFLEKKSPGGIASLRGEEVSLHQSHWAVVGNRKLIANSKYDNGVQGVRLFLKDFGRSKEACVIASLPEYWLYHWDKWKDFASWGADGYEIANSAPKALDFPEDRRRQVIDFCKEKNLIVTGITDTHGWGSTVYAWNVMTIQGWEKIAPEKLEQAVIETLKRERFNAVRVMVRAKAEPSGGRVRPLLDPVRQVWAASRAMPLSHAAVSFFWLWSPWLAWLFLRFKSQPKQNL